MNADQWSSECVEHGDKPPRRHFLADFPQRAPRESVAIETSLLSSDAVRTYKPAAAAYALGAPPSESASVSSNGWDATDAGWVDYTTSGSIASVYPSENPASQRTALAAAWQNAPPSPTPQRCLNGHHHGA